MRRPCSAQNRSGLAIDSAYMRSYFAASIQAASAVSSGTGKYEVLLIGRSASPFRETRILGAGSRSSFVLAQEYGRGPPRNSTGPEVESGRIRPAAPSRFRLRPE